MEKEGKLCESGKCINEKDDKEDGDKPKKVAIITENFSRVWKPDDIDDFLGGSQEVVVLLADALQRAGYQTVVFLHGKTKSDFHIREGVLYVDMSEFYMYHRVLDVLIMFKVCPFLRLPDVKNIIFWSSDVQANIGLNPENVFQNYVCLTEFHKRKCTSLYKETYGRDKEDIQNPWENALVIPHGIDVKSLLKNKKSKVKNTFLYCSSLDRGFEHVFNNIEKINGKVFITYGFKILENILDKDINEEEFVSKLEKHKNLEYLGNVDKQRMEELFWECEYWLLPLNNENSELFCLSALKAQFCGCIPVIYKKGALLESVGRYIDFNDFISGNRTIREEPLLTPVLPWDTVVQKYWKDIL
jgi:hypothetical protein